MPKSVRELRIDAVLNSVTTAAVENASKKAAALDGFDAVDKPTTLRLNRRTACFYEALANEVGVSRNQIMHMLLEHLASSSLGFGPAATAMKRATR